ncbi:MAG: 16S rRNA (cytosine(1402)-N(4))-methyltransferase RsmH [Oscillospiraceae bacterium]|jgi:16S rRNA (cytosine1402-N4)-methyltransferase|nr:16S rRNA (cytosine(1402)-N(4))-methyltransferase RsmH [Oscillospiraceae bacterium]
MDSYHEPVLFGEAITALNVQPGGVYVDGTLGGGGHASGILARLNGTGRLFGIDKDTDALTSAAGRLRGAANLTLIHGDFHDMAALLAGHGASSIDGALLDLGVSSHQLDTPERGFSYHSNAPLDMRMDAGQGETAADMLARLDEAGLSRIFREYGEENWSSRVAKVIVSRRERSPIRTTLDLVDCVDAAVPKPVRMRDTGHPARRVFQALRIAVNDELAPLERSLESIVGMLNPGGRLCVITFHSLEDRIVKQTFARLRKPCACPPDFPVCVCGKLPTISMFGAKPISPAGDEVTRNPRSRGARLRAVEKL